MDRVVIKGGAPMDFLLYPLAIALLLYVLYTMFNISRENGIGTLIVYCVIIVILAAFGL